MVSTASPNLKSIFGTYTIIVDDSNFQQIMYDIGVQLERQPQVFLDLEFPHYDLSPSMKKEIVTIYEENIISLKNIEPEVLLQPDLQFVNLVKIDLNFSGITDTCKTIFEAILARYGQRLEHLGVYQLDQSHDLQVPHMPKLYSLSLWPFNDASITFSNKLRKENITHLQIGFENTVPLEQLAFPNVQYLDLKDACGEHANTKALSIINTNKDNLKSLKLCNFKNIDIPDIIIPNLQCLELWGICEKFALNLIKSNKNTIRKLIIWDIDFPSPLPVIQMPKLNCLFLANCKKFSKLEFFKAFGRNISELWTPNQFGNNSHDSISWWKLESTKELNKLKVEADALQEV